MKTFKVIESILIFHINIDTSTHKLQKYYENEMITISVSKKNIKKLNE